MKKSILFYTLVLIIFLIGVFFWGGWYNNYRKFTSDILIRKDWVVEGNGEYNRISFFSDQTFKIYIFPEEIDSGSWSFDGKQLELDFNKRAENRVYLGFEFGRDSALYSLTDENRERWVPVKKK